MGSGPFWASPFGHALGWKLGAVVAMIVISGLHDFGPAASCLTPDSPESLRMRRRGSWLARINALVGVVLVVAAVRLARGG